MKVCMLALLVVLLLWSFSAEALPVTPFFTNLPAKTIQNKGTPPKMATSKMLTPKGTPPKTLMNTKFVTPKDRGVKYTKSKGKKFIVVVGMRVSPELLLESCVPYAEKFKRKKMRREKFFKIVVVKNQGEF
ncbi:hypothetical protein HELRODRAFT_181492 [Helobdella robusta]|uniref:Uncharacterized protein n=1 Tax=Helobdella robusta TaxID=6412 RepID=T1FH24_HELRO|nr:hypothetical protein HELRODRAFT_181492 [Helobdella robusta]ESN92302.1 hypothetical protein HELRODRAFT_181492 [Helobdella robusta]